MVERILPHFTARKGRHNLIVADGLGLVANCTSAGAEETRISCVRALRAPAGLAGNFPLPEMDQARALQ